MPNVNTVRHLKPVRDPGGRAPICDDMAERSILSAAMDELQPGHATAFDRVVDILKPEHFFDARHQHIYAAMQGLHAVGATVTWFSVMGWLKDRDNLGRAGSEKYLGEIVGRRAVTVHLEQDAVRIRDLWRQREMVARCQRIAAEGYDRHGSVQEWLEAGARTIEELAVPPDASSSVTIGEALQEVFSDIEQAAARGEGITGITTGFQELDEILGGWHDEELTIIGARPAMGKSAIGMSFALNAANAPGRDGLMNGVAFFSVEMSRAQLASRTICTQAGVNYQKVKRGCVQPADWPALAQSASWMSSLPVWIDDYSGLTPTDLRAKCRKVAAKAKQSGKARLALVVVDYLQRMKSGLTPDKRMSRQQEVAHISWSLKSLAKELQVPIIALAQVGRDVTKGKDNRPQLSDLREAGDIEQDADNVIFLHREAYYLKDKTPDDWRDVAELIVEKQRNGPIDTAYVRFVKESARFESVPGLGARLRQSD